MTGNKPPSDNQRRFRFTLSYEAEADLLEIWSYIAEQGGRRRADAMLRRLDTCFRRLGRFPQMGRSRPEFGYNARSFVHESWIIYYTIDPITTQLLVARVLHAARDQMAAMAAPQDDD